MNDLRFLRPLAAALLCLAAPAIAQSGAAPDAAARIRQGKALFDAVGCAGCHGYSGQGGIGPMAGPRINQLPAEAITAIIRMPPEPMPPFSAKVLPDDKVQLIGEYLHAQPPAPPASETDPHFPVKLTGLPGHGVTTRIGSPRRQASTTSSVPR